MRRTRIYLDESLWSVLRARARQEGTSVSELLRRAIREWYVRGLGERRLAMQALVGIWREREDIRDAEKYVRDLRKSDRIESLHKR